MLAKHVTIAFCGSYKPIHQITLGYETIENNTKSDKPGNPRTG